MRSNSKRSVITSFVVFIRHDTRAYILLFLTRNERTNERGTIEQEKDKDYLCFIGPIRLANRICRRERMSLYGIIHLRQIRLTENKQNIVDD